LRERGPLLVTHWGLSGPAILKLSAWGARTLHGLNYQFPLLVNWLPALNDGKNHQGISSAARIGGRKTAGERAAVSADRAAVGATGFGGRHRARHALGGAHAARRRRRSRSKSRARNFP
jgi:predicted flavoprotein YhiN